MNESIIIVVATALFGAISKLWFDVHKLSAEHLQCEIKLAEVKGNLGILHVQMKHMEKRLGKSTEETSSDEEDDKVQI